MGVKQALKDALTNSQSVTVGTVKFSTIGCFVVGTEASGGKENLSPLEMRGRRAPPYHRSTIGEDLHLHRHRHWPNRRPPLLVAALSSNHVLPWFVATLGYSSKSPIS
jgi:hypothetical protein